MKLQDAIDDGKLTIVVMPTMNAEDLAEIEREIASERKLQRERERAEVLELLDVTESCIRHGWDPTQHGGDWNWFTDECPLNADGWPVGNGWPGKWAPAKERKPLDQCQNQTWSLQQAKLYAIKRTRDSYEPLSLALDTALHKRFTVQWDATTGSPFWADMAWEIMPGRTVDDVLRLIEEARKLVKRDKVLSRDELEELDTKAIRKWERRFPGARRMPKWPWS